jgi:hypothetical protein
MVATVMTRLPALVALVALSGPSGPARAADEARISRLETEIQQLRAQIDEQNRRIQRLETELARRAGAGAAAGPRPKIARAAQAETPAPKGRQPWHSPATWDRVAKGMSSEQVAGILGQPTAVESVDELKTLFYRGSTVGGAVLQGHVNLRDDRVVAVSKPAF